MGRAGVLAPLPCVGGARAFSLRESWSRSCARAICDFVCLVSAAPALTGPAVRRSAGGPVQARRRAQGEAEGPRR